MTWIPIEERLPEESGYYLVFSRRATIHMDISYFRKAPANQGGTYWRGGITKPEAWMPLPEDYVCKTEYSFIESEDGSLVFHTNDEDLKRQFIEHVQILLDGVTGRRIIQEKFKNAKVIHTEEDEC